MDSPTTVLLKIRLIKGYLSGGEMPREGEKLLAG